MVEVNSFYRPNTVGGSHAPSPEDINRIVSKTLCSLEYEVMDKAKKLSRFQNVVFFRIWGDGQSQKTQ
jgi:hypothetical protein